MALKEDLISVEEANGFSATQQAQAAATSMRRRSTGSLIAGMQVNGSMDISQELGTTGATLASGTARYIADCIQGQYVRGKLDCFVAPLLAKTMSRPSTP